MKLTINSAPLSAKCAIAQANRPMFNQVVKDEGKNAVKRAVKLALSGGK